MDIIDLISGVTDKDTVVADRFGVDMDPSEVGWVFDIGCGDGLWSRVMEDYAPSAKIHEYDWRMAALGRPSVQSVYLSLDKEMMVPRAILSNTPNPSRASQLMVDMMECTTMSIGDLLKKEEADPARTIVRVCCVKVRDVIQQLENIPPLLMFILQTPSTDVDTEGALVSAMLGTKYVVVQKKEKGILYVNAKPIQPPDETDGRETGSEELVGDGSSDDRSGCREAGRCDRGVSEEPDDHRVSADNP